LAEKPKELANLARIRKLTEEPGTAGEIKGLVASGTERLNDARNEKLALSSRFDLAYNAAHAFSLAALRWHGYRSDNRYLVFQALPHALGSPAGVWRVPRRRTIFAISPSTRGISTQMKRYCVASSKRPKKFGLPSWRCQH
jgi:hypothetical protein